MRKITLGHLQISDLGKRYVNEALNNNRLSYGPFTKRFEEEFARLHQSKYAVFCNSGTSALQIALASLKEFYGYRNEAEILVPSVTFIATSNIVLQNNMKPVFVDVDPLTFNIDPSKIREKITSKTRAIIPVHLFGLPADMYGIRDAIEGRPIQVIEDSCETMFASQNGKQVGSFGHLACFSTYVNHIITGGVGGLVTTSDPELEKLCRSLMAHGRNSIYTNIDADNDLSGSKLQDMMQRRFRFERVGYSYRCTELEAAIALSELYQWKINIGTRRKNAELLTKKLSDLQDYLQLPVIPENFIHSFMMYAIVLKIGNRDDLLTFLEEKGVETRYLFPLLSQPIYQKLFPGEARKYPVAEHLARQGFFIGVHQGLIEEDINYLSDIFHRYFGETYAV